MQKSLLACTTWSVSVRTGKLLTSQSFAFLFHRKAGIETHHPNLLPPCVCVRIQADTSTDHQPNKPQHDEPIAQNKHTTTSRLLLTTTLVFFPLRTSQTNTSIHIRHQYAGRSQLSLFSSFAVVTCTKDDLRLYGGPPSPHNCLSSSLVFDGRSRGHNRDHLIIE